MKEVLFSRMAGVIIAVLSVGIVVALSIIFDEKKTIVVVFYQPSSEPAFSPGEIYHVSTLTVIGDVDAGCPDGMQRREYALEASPSSWVTVRYACAGDTDLLDISQWIEKLRDHYKYVEFFSDKPPQLRLAN